jgi:putative MATE family efflux protein
MKDLTTGNEGRLILSFTWPMLLGNVLQQLYGIVDSIVVGNYIGKEALAAVGASFPIIFALISMVMGIAMGITIVIAQYFGAKDFEKVRRAIDTMYIFLFFAGIILTLVGILISHWLFEQMGLPAELLPMAETYLDNYLIGLLAFFGYNGTAAALRGLGDSRTPLYFLIIATVVNLILVLLFVGVFRWGIAGAAWATVLAQAGAFFTGIWYLNKKHTLMKFSLREIRFDREIFRKSVRVGVPSGLQQTFVSLGMIALFVIVNSFGTNVIAAFSVAGRIDGFAMLPAMNFSMALSTFTGQNMGAGKPERIRNGLNSTLIYSGGISVMVTILVIFAGQPLMGLFSQDPEVIRIGWEYLVIVSSFYIVFSLMFTFNGLMRGAGDTLIPMFITVLSLWLIRIPIAAVLSKTIGEHGIWWSVPAAWTVGAIFSYIYYRTGRWKRAVLVKRPG